MTLSNGGSGRTGVTVVELVVVVAVLLVLAVAGYPLYSQVLEKARANEALTVLSAIRQSEQRYLAATGAYTNNVANLDTDIPAMKSWNFTRLTAQSAECARRSGQQMGQRLGIVFTSGVLCGDFDPIRPPGGACP